MKCTVISSQREYWQCRREVSCAKADPGWLSGWTEEQAQRNKSAHIRGGRQSEELWKLRWGWMLTRHRYPEHTNENLRESNATISDMGQEKNLADVFQLNCMPERSWQVSAAIHGPHKHFTSCLFRHGWEMQQTTSANNEVTESLCRALHCQVQENCWTFFFLFALF